MEIYNRKKLKFLFKKIRKNIVCIKDGSINLNQKYFKYMSGLRMVDNNNFKKLFNLKKKGYGRKNRAGSL